MTQRYKRILLATAIVSCPLSVSFAADSAPQYRNWDAKSYSEHNRIQELVADQAFIWSKINLAQKKVLDAGCGTGNISKKITEKAQSVEGIDASVNMINWALAHYPHTPGLTFRLCAIQELNRQEEYDLVTAFSVLHWVDDKETALSSLYKGLKSGGELLFTLETEEAEESLTKQAAREVLPFIETIESFAQAITSHFKTKDLNAMAGSSIVGKDQILKLVQKIGFEVIKTEDSTIEARFASKDEVKKFMWPLVSTTPIAQLLPRLILDFLFERFIDKLLGKLIKEGDGFIYPFSQTFVHVRKP